MTINVSVNGGNGGGSLVLPPGSLATQFPYTYSSAAAAMADLNGLQFVADSTFQNSTTVTLTASTTINGTTYTTTETIPLLTGNTHLVVKQSLNTTTPTNPDTAIITVTVTNPGGPDGQDGTNVQVQNYLSRGVTVLSSSASQGSFNPNTGLWTIGNLPITGNNTVTLTLTVKADPSTYDTLLSSTAQASSTLFNYPDTDAQSVVSLLPVSHDIVVSPATLPDGANGAPYYEQFTADRGGGGPYTYTLASGSLPNGITLTSNGFLSGVPQPSTQGTFSFSITVTNGIGTSTTVPYQLTFANASVAVVGTPYSFVIDTATNFSYTLESGSLPSGLSVRLSSLGYGAVSGTPTTPFYSFTISRSVAGTPSKAIPNRSWSRHRSRRGRPVCRPLWPGPSIPSNSPAAAAAAAASPSSPPAHFPPVCRSTARMAC